jgi:serine protease Do
MPHRPSSGPIVISARHCILGGVFLAFSLFGTAGVGFWLARHGVPSLAPAAQAAPPQDTASALSLAFTQVAQKARASVVNISTVDAAEGEVIGSGTGSGFIINREGYIVTNLHVVQTATRIKVRLADGSQQVGRMIAGDEETDVAVIKIPPRADLQPLPFGDSDILRVGDWVVAIGSPFGLEQTVTTGIISAKERVTDRKHNLQQFLQTDAAINPGNSGGPLLNLSGEVIGINTQIASPGGSFSGIGFALPSQTVREVSRQLITTGRVSRSLLGVYIDRVSPQFARVYGLPSEKGALVQYFEENGPAQNAGLQSGDVIVEFNGQTVTSDRDLLRLLATTPGDTTVKVRYIRDGQSHMTAVKTDERTSAPTRIGPPRIQRRGDAEDARPQSSRKLGIVVAALTPLKLRQANLEGLFKKDDGGVLVAELTPFGVAAEAGVAEGAVITSVNRRPIASEADFEAAIQRLNPNDDVVIVMKRAIGRRANGERRIVTNYVSLTMP